MTNFPKPTRRDILQRGAAFCGAATALSNVDAAMMIRSSPAASLTP